MKFPLVQLFFIQTMIKGDTSYDLVCPSSAQWKIRANALCLGKNRYACLLNRTYEKYNENCKGPDIADRGYKLVFQPMDFNLAKCLVGRYQPITFSSIGSSDCVLQKSKCSEEGQVVCNGNSLEGDVTCRCDKTKGYIFVSNTLNPCYCIPSKEDCSCFNPDKISRKEKFSFEVEESFSQMSSSCGNVQDVCIDLRPTVPEVQTNLSYVEHRHSTYSITGMKIYTIALCSALVLIVIGFVRAYLVLLNGRFDGCSAEEDKKIFELLFVFQWFISSMLKIYRLKTSSQNYFST